MFGGWFLQLRRICFLFLSFFFFFFLFETSWNFIENALWFLFFLFFRLLFRWGWNALWFVFYLFFRLFFCWGFLLQLVFSLAFLRFAFWSTFFCWNFLSCHFFWFRLVLSQSFWFWSGNFHLSFVSFRNLLEVFWFTLRLIGFIFPLFI